MQTSRTTTYWFAQIGDCVPGDLKTVVGDGSYDGQYHITESLWLIKRGRIIETFDKVTDFWHVLNASQSDWNQALTLRQGGVLAMINRIVDFGRAISKHDLWDDLELDTFRNPTFDSGVVTYFSYRSQLFAETNKREAEIWKIEFDTMRATHQRSHVATILPKSC